MIPRNTRVAEAPSHGKPILLYDVNSAGSQAYMRLAAEIIERNGVTRLLECDRPRGRHRRRDVIRGTEGLWRLHSRRAAWQGLASLIGDPVLTESKLPPEGEQRVVPSTRSGAASSIRGGIQGEIWSSGGVDPPEGACPAHLCAPGWNCRGYEIVAGVRRWRAAQLANLHSMP